MSQRQMTLATLPLQQPVVENGTGTASVTAVRSGRPRGGALSGGTARYIRGNAIKLLLRAQQAAKCALYVDYCWMRHRLTRHCLLLLLMLIAQRLVFLPFRSTGIPPERLLLVRKYGYVVAPWYTA